MRLCGPGYVVKSQKVKSGSFLNVTAGHVFARCAKTCLCCREVHLPPHSYPDIDTLIALISRLCYNLKLHTLTHQCETSVACIDSGVFYSLAV